MKIQSYLYFGLCFLLRCRLRVVVFFPEIGFLYLHSTTVTLAIRFSIQLSRAHDSYRIIGKNSETKLPFGRPLFPVELSCKSIMLSNYLRSLINDSHSLNQRLTVFHSHFKEIAGPIMRKQIGLGLSRRQRHATLFSHICKQSHEIARLDT